MESLDVIKSKTLINIYILYFKTIILIYPLPLAQYVGFIICDLTESTDHPGHSIAMYVGFNFLKFL